ncbi:hypothetical protein HII28_11790 [Planctomonas sp. JC2975]|uniref:hypothetical protein n=1 Tax=Planctomonas sp. JC2975 TaxID=2729626 RepID=UPI0014748E3A|nr:hypothetical protein [Planctomonas sp. JC2975]NNC12557.1 hypothetical protein [Planctomonas sp. JC2975]
MSEDLETAAVNTGAEPEAVSTGEFNIRVVVNGVSQGWWTDNGSPEWWITTVSDQSDSTTWTWVDYNGGRYLKKSTNNYLSYRSGNVIYSTGLKMRAWAYAARWNYDPRSKQLSSVDNDNALVGRNGDYFYCNGENVVELELVAV